MANYWWIISHLECRVEEAGKNNVVSAIHWRRQASSGSHHADVYGSQAVTLDPNQPFYPYEGLTETMVIGWLETAMKADKIAEIDATLDKEIENQISPPVIMPPLPWVE